MIFAKLVHKTFKAIGLNQRIKSNFSARNVGKLPCQEYGVATVNNAVPTLFSQTQAF